MIFVSEAVAMVLPGYVRLGPLQLPVYGLFAAVGLVAALLLSQQTAKRSGVPADGLWNAGIFAIVAAFVASRVLLIVFDLPTFFRFPLLVLTLPSLTFGGMLLMGLAVWWWLGWKKLPALAVLDAWAPCIALLDAVLSVAHFIEGTDAGMPTSLPWGVITPGDTVLGPVHPVQLYEAFIALALGVVYYRALSRRWFDGQVAGFALVSGGAAIFLLDMLRQPVDSQSGFWLDPVQFVALTCVAAGLLLRWRLRVPPPAVSRLEAAEILENFALERESKPYEHEFIEDGNFTDPLLIEIQKKVFFDRLTEEQKTEMLQYAQRLRDNPIKEVA